MSEIEIVLPLTLPFPKYEGSWILTLIFPISNFQHDIKIPLSSAKDLKLFHLLYPNGLTFHNNSDFPLRNSKNVADTDVDWTRSIEIIQTYFEPIPLDQIYLNQKDHIILKIRPSDAVQTYVLSKMIGINELMYLLELKMSTLDLHDSLIVFRVLDKFLQKKERVSELRTPIIENISTYLLNIPQENENQFILDENLRSLSSFASVMIRFHEKLQTFKIQEQKLLSIKWLLLVYSNYMKNTDFSKAEIVRLLLKIGDVFLLWIYSFIIEELDVSKEERENIQVSLQNFVKNIPKETTEAITNTFVACFLGNESTQKKGTKTKSQINKKFMRFLEHFEMLQYVEISRIDPKMFTPIINDITMLTQNQSDGLPNGQISQFFEAFCKNS